MIRALALLLLLAGSAWADPEIYFSPKGGVAHVVAQAILEAQDSVLVAIYDLNEPEIVAALIAAHTRGVDVRVIADRRQSKGAHSAVGRLQRAGVPVHVQSGSGGGILHLKTAVIDRRRVLAGSFNWTHHAECCNDENLLILDDVGIVLRTLTRLELLWNKEAP